MGKTSSVSVEVKVLFKNISPVQEPISRLMRILFASILILNSTTLTSFAAGSGAQPVIGSGCPTQGMKIQYQGQPLTCTRNSQGKLSWTGNVAIARPTNKPIITPQTNGYGKRPIQTPAPFSKASPTPTINPSSNQAVKPGDAVVVNKDAKIGVTPTFSEYVGTQDGFTFTISNYDPKLNWTVKSSRGSAIIDATGQVTVSGLRIGQNCLVTITTNATGFTTGSSSIFGSPLAGDALIPTFERFTPTTDGYKVHVANYSGQYKWVVASTSGTVSIDSSGYINGVGVAFGSESLLTVSTSRDGYASGSSTFVVNMPIGNALNPTLSSTSITCSTATYRIANFDPAFVWTVSSTVGKTSIDNQGNVLVTQLGSGASFALTVSTSRNGYNPGKTVVNGSALTGICLAPLIDKIIQTSSGFQVAVINYSPTYTWTVTSTSGSVNLDQSSGLLTVTDLPYGQSSTVSIKTEKKGSLTSVVTFTSSSLLGPAFDPIFDIPVSIVGGFTVNIVNYSPSVTWSAKTSSGTVTISQSGVITVIGLTPGSTATVEVTSTLLGRQNGVGRISAQSSK